MIEVIPAEPWIPVRRRFTQRDERLMARMCRVRGWIIPVARPDAYQAKIQLFQLLATHEREIRSRWYLRRLRRSVGHPIAAKVLSRAHLRIVEANIAMTLMEIEDVS